MAVPQLQIPSYAAPQTIDFATPLAQLGQQYQQGQKRMLLSDLAAGGNQDPQALIRAGLATGDMSLATLGINSLNRQQDQARQAAQDQLQRERYGIEDKRADRQFAQSSGYQNAQLEIARRTADRADDKTPANFVADPNAPGGYRPIGPADPAYLAEVERKKAEAKGDVPQIIYSGGEVIIPNKAKEGPLYTAAPKPTGPVMDDGTADFLAERVLAGDSRALVGLGRGAQGSENIAKIQKLVAEKAQAKGINATGILTNIAAQAGQTSAFRALGTSETKFGMAEKAAQESFPIAMEASAAVPRTQWLAATKLIQMGQTQVNDPNLKKFLIATDTAVKDYARTINPGGVLRESDIEYARKILSTADSPEAYAAAINQLNTEVGVMHRAIQRQKQELKTGRDPGVGHGGTKPAGNVTSGGVKWSVE